jgi:hypothetical protein
MIPVLKPQSAYKLKAVFTMLDLALYRATKPKIVGASIAIWEAVMDFEGSFTHMAFICLPCFSYAVPISPQWSTNPKEFSPQDPPITQSRLKHQASAHDQM